MTNIVKLKFEVICYAHDEVAEQLGEELALFLQESWINGEDVLEVRSRGYDLAESYDGKEGD